MATTKVRKPFLAVAGGLVLSLAFGLLTATASWGDPLKEAVQSDRRTAAFGARPGGGGNLARRWLVYRDSGPAAER